MADAIYFEVGQSIQARSGVWFRCIQHLGTGGNAVTYLVAATSGQFKGVLFALKVFRKLSVPERRKRFLDEVAFLEKCAHPSIMRVFDAGEFRIGDQLFPFVVAEYLPVRLFDTIRSDNASMPEKISYALQLLSALVYLSDGKPAAVHRDIKPQNIFVKGKACVLGDFGLMKLLDATNEVDRDIFKESIGPGMPFFYRTPDLVAYARNESDLTTRSDVFQLGLVLAELFTGRNPAVRPNHILDPVELEPLGNIPGGMGASVASLIKRMLVEKADEREEAAVLMDGWFGAFETVVDRAHGVNGRAF